MRFVVEAGVRGSLYTHSLRERWTRPERSGEVYCGLALASLMTAGRLASFKSGDVENVCQRPITGVARVTSLMGHRMLLPADNAVRPPLIRQPPLPAASPAMLRLPETPRAADGRG